MADTPQHLLWSFSPHRGKSISKESSCQIEADICAEDILNVYRLKWESLDDVTSDDRMLESLIGFWPEDISFMNSRQLTREVQGELCDAIHQIKNAIHEKQTQFKGSPENSHSMDGTAKKKLSILISALRNQEGAMTPISAANTVLDRYSPSASLSPIRPEHAPTSEVASGLEEEALPIESFDDDTPADDEMEDGHETAELIQKDIDNIMGCCAETEDTATSETNEESEHHSMDVNDIKGTTLSEAESHRRMDTSKMDDAVASGNQTALFLSIKNPPSRQQVMSHLEKEVTAAENCRPYYGLGTIIDKKSWKQIPRFNDTKSQLEKIRGQLGSSTAVPNLSSYKDRKGCWTWRTCQKPPSRQTVNTWLVDISLSVTHSPIPAPFNAAKLPTIEEEEIIEALRPGSPKYDESTSYFHTPQSLAKTTADKKRRNADGFSDKRHDNFDDDPSNLSGTTNSHSSRQKKPWKSDTGFRIVDTANSQHLVICCIEIHAASRNALLPDPRYDSVHCIVISAARDSSTPSDVHHKIFVFHPSLSETSALAIGLHDTDVQLFSDEWEMISCFSNELILLDPDIVAGFEMQNASLGYIAERALVHDISLLNEIAKMPRMTTFSVQSSANIYDEQHRVQLHCTGRVLLDVWRLLLREVKLNIYSFENCAAEVLKIRLPKVPQSTLHRWFMSSDIRDMDRCLRHVRCRTTTVLEMLDHLDIIGRTSEMARIFGVDFFSVLTRGSQYRVESMFVRLAHSQNYLMISPSKQQVFEQPGMECVPLVMEPYASVVTDPVVVLDFQSLYPSIAIAYNLCFSTICGKNVAASRNSIKLGVMSEYTPSEILWDGSVKAEHFVVTPNGMVFLPPEKKKGVLPRLLKEILDTRIMIKQQMKALDPEDEVFMRCLNSRQYGLKMIANVTYGYTAAGFSGRMPMAELADAIVQTGRQTLINAINLIESHPDWNARIAYGDTDSVFVQLPGRNRQQAFEIGKEIAAAVTRANPSPVELKMEKVYHPCVLLTKKRYVGFKYETEDQQKGIIDAKGIETIRKDACPAVSKILHRVLHILFQSKDINKIKDYLERQWGKILSGQASPKDFIYAKEVRMDTYRSQQLPPAAIVAAKAIRQDRRREPLYGERIPYVVVYGQPGSRLIDLVVDPETLIISRGDLKINALYYITKQINPALDRVLALIGISVQSWFAAIPWSTRTLPHKRRTRASSKGQKTIDSYYISRHCPVCDEMTYLSDPVCPECQSDAQKVHAVLVTRSVRLEATVSQLESVCLHCGDYSTSPAADFCQSFDCEIFFERNKLREELKAVQSLRNDPMFKD